MIINLPFSGFYYSEYDRELDYVEEREIEHLEEKHQLTNAQADELSGILFNSTDWGVAHRMVAEAYVEAFNEKFKEWTDIDLGLKFESMSSPREYNFATDRIFCHISDEVVHSLFDGADREKLAKVIRERFTSYDGFISFYSNYLPDWLETDVDEWDHNELCTLLMSWLPEDWSWAVFEEMVNGSEVFYSAWSEAVDWPKVEAWLEEIKTTNNVTTEDAV